MAHVSILQHMTTSATSGLDLKLARVARRIKQKPLGDAMGVSASRVAAIEREAIVTSETVARYLAALDTCGTSTSPATVPATS